MGTGKEMERIKRDKMFNDEINESEIICYYYTGEEPHSCLGPMGDERHYVIKDGKMVLAHKRCHDKSQIERSGVEIIIKGNACTGGSCRR